jgi:NADH dehydrogenase
MGKTVIIVGAGFAGLAAARQLSRIARRQPGLSVILFDRHPFTTMVPSLPDLAGGRFPGRRLTGPIASLLPPGIQFRQEQVVGLHFQARHVLTDHGPTPYDYLILACGSVTDFHGFNQHRESIHALDFLEDAERLFRDFTAHLNTHESPAVVIAGGGYTGLELAASLQDAARTLGKPVRITVVEHQPSLLPAMPDWVRTYMLNQLRRRGIELVTGATVSAFDGRHATLSTGRILEDSFLCWSTGTRFPITRVTGNHTQMRDGRFEVDEFLRLPAHPEVIAAGDAAAIRWNGAILRKAVNFSRDSGRAAGLTVERAILGRPPVRYTPIDLGWVIPFGDVGVGLLFSRLALRGRLPLMLHYAMCSLRNFTAGNRLFYWKTALASLFRPG